MPIIEPTKAEYGPNDKKGRLEPKPTKGHSRLVDAYGQCPKCLTLSSVLIRAQKSTVECGSCKSFGHIHDYTFSENGAVKEVYFDWAE